MGDILYQKSNKSIPGISDDSHILLRDETGSQQYLLALHAFSLKYTSAMFSSSILALLGAATLSSAHTVITYPGWRGDNLITNDTFPYGMQWMYPCEYPASRISRRRCTTKVEMCLTNSILSGGGHPTTTNRTYWSTEGGAVAFQPGWFQGHQTAFMYINLGFGTDGPDGGPENMSFPMVSPFQIVGPSANPYPGTVCIPEVPLPSNTTVKAGDLATIQVVEIAKHGAALFSVRVFPRRNKIEAGC